MTTPQNNPFTNASAPGSAEPAPRPRDLAGCLVAYAPTSFTPAGAPGNETGYNGDKPRDRVTTDLIILATPNGAPVQFGGHPEVDSDPKPHDRMVYAPAKFTGVWVSNVNIVAALAPGGNVAHGQMVLGRVERSSVGQKPFNLVPVGQEDMAQAVGIWSQIQMGGLPYRPATNLQGGPIAPPQAPANSVSYAQPQFPAQAYAPPAPAQPTYQPQPVQQQWPAQPAPVAAPSWPQPAAPQWSGAVAPVPAYDPAAAAIAAQFPQAAPIPQAPAPAAPVAAPPPPGWSAEAWQQVPPQQRADIYRQMGLAVPTGM